MIPYHIEGSGATISALLCFTAFIERGVGVGGRGRDLISRQSDRPASFGCEVRKGIHRATCRGIQRPRSTSLGIYSYQLRRQSFIQCLS